MTDYTISTDSMGRVSVRTDDDGDIHREVLPPGFYSGAGTWVATDTSGYPPEVQAACAEAWTPQVVAAYRAAFPYRAPAADPDQPRKAALAADANYLDLLGRARTATPAQIDSWLASNVTTLPQARTVLGALVKFVALHGA